jgi:hypothetical protein
MTTQEIFSPYAAVALAAAKELKKIEKKMKVSNTPREKRILKRQFENIKSLINRTFRLTGDFMPVHISKMAKKFCIDNKLGDITKTKSNYQAKFEKQTNRDNCNLKHEHKIPVGALVKSLCDSTNLDEAINIFENQEIVWVTREEDKRLPRTNRPNSDACYRDAGIQIIKNKREIGNLFD